MRMKPLIRLATAALTVGVVIATPLGASATTQERISVSGIGADAIFTTCPNGPVPGGQACTLAQIGVNSQVTKSDGSKSSETTLSIGIDTFKIDSSGNFVPISQTGGFGVPVWSIDSRLRSASATASFPVFTCTVDGCVDGTMTVVATWTGQGGVMHDVSNFHFSKGPFSGNFHSSGDTRLASASATFNGENFGPSFFADIRNVKSGDILICHGC